MPKKDPTLKNADSKEPESTPLHKYKQSKKILTPPLATLPNMVFSSWINDRLPEMLWAILIRHQHPGRNGYAIFRSIMIWLGDNKGKLDVAGVCHTDISNMPTEFRKRFIEKIVLDAGTNALKPLLLLKSLPAYEDWKKALEGSEIDPEKGWGQVADAVEKVLWHQSQEATDVRWVKLVGTILTGKINFFNGMKDRVEEIQKYPDLGDQGAVRASIRSMEMMGNMDGTTTEWPEEFWRFSYENTLCFPEYVLNEDRYKLSFEEVAKDKAFYAKRLETIRHKLLDHFMKTAVNTKIDTRHESVFGLAIYALDTYIETSILETSGTVSGRATARIILESYLTLAYLTHKENTGNPGWDIYHDYGSGQLNLIVRKYTDESYESGMVDLKLIDRLANEDKWTEYVPINVGNWDGSDLRKISILINKKELYDKYYPYTSGFLHGGWGSVRESSFQQCFNPLHRRHRIPSYTLPVLPNVTEDCRQILNLIFKLVHSSYPGFTDTLRKRPIRKKHT